MRENFKNKRISTRQESSKKAMPSSSGHASVYRGSPSSNYPATTMARASFGRRRGFGRGRGGNSNKGAWIDESRFINKASENNHVDEYVAKHKFSDYKISEALKKNIALKGYVKPTSIQDKAIPEILDGKDMIGLADTGTGKTAVFLIPIIDKVLKDKKQKGLVIAPTRELAIQINNEFRELTRDLNIYSVAVVGGAGIREQIYQIKRGCNVLIGTPGRLKDLAKRGYINLEEYQTVVLDEADRMLDMGFIADIKALLSHLPKERHTLLFSATLSKEIESLSQHFLKDPIKIETKIRDTSSNVDQDVIRVKTGEDKMEILQNLLSKEEFKKVLIFGKTKIGVERVSNTLKDAGFRVSSIHGDKNQSGRQQALRAFREHKIKILVATDVAARGLDIPEVTHVINFDLPNTYEDYIHRIGRTGRANKKGTSLTFVGSIHDKYASVKKPFSPRPSFKRTYGRYSR